MWAIEKDFAMELTIEELSQRKVTPDKRRHEVGTSCLRVRRMMRRILRLRA